MSTVESTGGGLERDALSRLWRKGAGELGAVDDGCEAEVGLLLGGEDVASIADAVDGHGGAVVLDGAQMAAGAHGLVPAAVVHGAVLVGILALHGASEAIFGRLAGGLESLGEQTQLSELEAVSALERAVALLALLDGSVGTFCDHHSVLVEDSGVVEVVGPLHAVLLEHLSLSLVEDGPVVTVVGGLDSPGAGGADVASGTGDEGVGGDELPSVVVVGPLRSGADAARTADVDGSLDVVEQLVELVVDIEIAGGDAVQ